MACTVGIAGISESDCQEIKPAAQIVSAVAAFLQFAIELMSAELASDAAANASPGLSDSVSA